MPDGWYLSELWRALWFTDLQFDLEMSRRRSVVEISPRDYDHIQEGEFCYVKARFEVQLGKIMHVDFTDQICTVETPDGPAVVTYQNVPFKNIIPVSEDDKIEAMKLNWREFIDFDERLFLTAEDICAKRFTEQENDRHREVLENAEKEKKELTARMDRVIVKARELKRHFDQIMGDNRKMRQKLNDARARIVELEHPLEQDIGSELEQDGFEEDGSEHEDPESNDGDDESNSSHGQIGSSDHSDSDEEFHPVYAARR
jgi:hypothetical protein